MREWITTLGELAGATLIACAAWRVAENLGVLVAGIELVLISWLASL